MPWRFSVASDRPCTTTEQRSVIGDPVAVPPHPRVGSEIGLPVARTGRVVPERHGHRRHRLGDDELTDGAADRLAAGVPRVEGHPQARRGQLTRPHRHDRRAAGEGADDVRAAGCGVDADPAAHVIGDPEIRVAGQRRTRRPERPQRGQVVITRRFHAGLGAAAQVRGAGAQQRDAMLGGQRPQRLPRRVARASVVTDDPGPGQQAGDEVVPHHPARRGVPEERVLFAEIEAERHRLQVLQQNPARAVHDPLGPAGGARGEQHPQRVAERHRLRYQLRRTRRARPAEPSGRVSAGRPSRGKTIVARRWAAARPAR